MDIYRNPGYGDREKYLLTDGLTRYPYTVTSDGLTVRDIHIKAESASTEEALFLAFSRITEKISAEIPGASIVARDIHITLVSPVDVIRDRFQALVEQMAELQRDLDAARDLLDGHNHRHPFR